MVVGRKGGLVFNLQDYCREFGVSESSGLTYLDEKKEMGFSRG